ncbi:MAG: hypothetical protein GWP18_03615 [Proteobacteria bacterium]|nr:hypothetical protein [Pseudomonadota bacterium]
MATDLVNTLDVITGGDVIVEPSDISAFIADHEGDFCVSSEPSPKDVEDLRQLRAHLRTVFEAQTTDAAAAVLNDILAAMPATPRISTHGDMAHIHFEPLTEGAVRWLGATAAMALSIALVEGGIERFGICDATACADVYVDTSKNRSRRYCSDTCSTRQSVAAFRERQKAGPES